MNHPTEGPASGHRVEKPYWSAQSPDHDAHIGSDRRYRHTAKVRKRRTAVAALVWGLGLSVGLLAVDYAGGFGYVLFTAIALAIMMLAWAIYEEANHEG